MLSFLSLVPATADISSPADKANIIVVLVDTLRADHLGAYGYARPTSPNMDRIAAEGVQFDFAIAPSAYTRESIAALFTGRYPSSNPWGSGWYASPGPEMPLMAEILREHGYATTLFSNTPMLEQLDFYQGFDLHRCLVTQYGISGAEQHLVREALRWMSRHTDTPFFAYLHLLDPHGPYDPILPWRNRFHQSTAHPLDLYRDVRDKIPELVASGFGPGDPRFEELVARYDEEILATDAAIGELFVGLRALGLHERTVLIFTADHGEEFLEHGFVEHGWRLYPETVHIPLVFWAPTLLKPQRTCTPASLVDLLPTLLALCGLPQPEGLDGRPLFVREQGTWHPTAESMPVFSQLLIQTRSVVHSVFYNGAVYLAAPKWLSPAECSVVSAQHRELVAQMNKGALPRTDPWAAPVYTEYYRWHCPNAPAPDSPPDVQMLQTLLESLREKSPPVIPDSVKLATFNTMKPEEAARLESLGYLGTPNHPAEGQPAP